MIKCHQLNPADSYLLKSAVICVEKLNLHITLQHSQDPNIKYISNGLKSAE